jgi:hypothetical protein
MESTALCCITSTVHIIAVWTVTGVTGTSDNRALPGRRHSPSIS